jgi:hypothetical protein
MALTDVQIKAAKPSEKPRKLSDSQGLCITITPAGGKHWRFKFYYGPPTTTKASPIWRGLFCFYR